MIPILAFSLLFLADPTTDPWSQVRLSIIRDPYTSSDHVTLCRVRAVNHGSRSWSGKSLVFEARGLGGGSVVVERGRFGLRLEPYGTLETLITLPGRHDRLEVSPLPAGDPDAKPRKRTRKPRPRS
jgi:hypothetical protein